MKLITGLFSFSIILMLFAAGCQNNSNQKEIKHHDTITSKKKPALVLSCDTTIISQEFSYEALAFSIFKSDTGQIKSLFLDPVVLKIEKKTNSEGGEYNLYNFTDGVNSLILFQNNGFYIEEAGIKNNRIRLNKKLSIGMNKGDFLNLLKVKNSKCDTISVNDDEASFESLYIFKDARLTEIKMGQILE